MKNNKGMTLVELLVFIAIASVVVLGVGKLIASGTKNFARTNAEATLQMESQGTMNQISDTIIEATDLKYDVTNPDKKILIVTTSEVVAGASPGQNIRKKKYCFIIFKRDDKKIYYGNKYEGEVDITDASAVASAVTGFSSDDYILGNNVHEMKMELPNTTARKIVKVKLTFGLDGKTFTLNNDVKLRNGNTSTSVNNVATGAALVVE